MILKYSILVAGLTVVSACGDTTGVADSSATFEDAPLDFFNSSDDDAAMDAGEESWVTDDLTNDAGEMTYMDDPDGGATDGAHDGYGGESDSGYGDNGYSDNGYGDNGYSDNGYGDNGYGYGGGYDSGYDSYGGSSGTTDNGYDSGYDSGYSDSSGTDDGYSTGTTGLWRLAHLGQPPKSFVEPALQIQRPALNRCPHSRMRRQHPVHRGRFY